MNRRRFLTITAGAAALPLVAAPLAASAAPLVWRGTALGAAATIALDHPDAQRLTDAALAEIERLENVFSLYRTDSALARLNRDGRLAAPPAELLDCLSLAGLVHAASDGRFDPTVQPLWQAHAESYARTGRAPDDATITAARARTGWGKVRIDEAAIHLPAGGALTLNGIAQGYIADRVAALLRGKGVENVLIDTGEIVALGDRTGGTGWSVGIKNGPRTALRDRAMATSASLGTTFDDGRAGHIIDPRTGRPGRGAWSQVTMTADHAAIADAASTAACLIESRDELARMVAALPGVTVQNLIA